METSLLEDAISQGSKCLIMLTKGHYKKEVFKQTMKKIWRPMKSIKFHDMSLVLILVEFGDIQDKDRVQCEGPWSLDKQLVLVKEFDGRQQVHQNYVTKAPFWIQIYDLPLMAQNEYISKLTGSFLGKAEEVDLVRGEMAWRKLYGCI